MIGGGVFDEVNQQATHSKETLRIRVGINTRVPVVAGVLGTEKPSFEILGFAINIAQQMERNSVPMQVHISRPVYKLI